MYTTHATQYAEAIADNVYNANLDRPSLLSMMPDVRGKEVLDLGCGPGEYAAELVGSGASVTALDASPGYDLNLMLNIL
jgi:2-polyprenyl-3-methyl-5-hydroxy-6-metoxy-1,4-benzoquinol methylase